MRNSNLGKPLDPSLIEDLWSGDAGRSERAANSLGELVAGEDPRQAEDARTELSKRMERPNDLAYIVGRRIETIVATKAPEGPGEGYKYLSDLSGRSIAFWLGHLTPGQVAKIVAPILAIIVVAFGIGFRLESTLHAIENANLEQTINRLGPMEKENEELTRKNEVLLQRNESLKSDSESAIVQIRELKESRKRLSEQKKEISDAYLAERMAQASDRKAWGQTQKLLVDALITLRQGERE